MVINSHFYNGDNFPIISRIMLLLQATGVVGIRPCVFLFPSCLDSAFFADPSFILQQCPFCPHHRSALALLLPYKLQEHITAESQVHCFGKYFKSENLECPLTSEFLSSSSFWSVSVSCSFKDCFFYLALEVFPGEIIQRCPSLYCQKRTHTLPALRSKGSQPLSLFALDFPSLD